MEYPNNPAAVKVHQAAFLQSLKSRTVPQFVTVEGGEIVVHPGVFPPATDTRLLAANIKVNPGETFVDTTTGSGVFGVIAGLQGAKGIAVDINPEAVRNAQSNFDRYNLPVRAIESDLFDKVPRVKVDHIFANGPYFEGEVTKPLEYAFYGARRFVDRLFSESPKYLKQNGMVLITFAEWGELYYATQAMKNNGFTYRIADSRSSDDGQRRYRLYEARITSLV